MKKCTQCLQDKPLDSFGRHKRYKDGIRSCCKKCHNLQTKDWERRHPDKVNARRRRRHRVNPSVRRRHSLKANYRVTPGQVERMFVEQGCKCAICGSPEHFGRNWHIDHCHAHEKATGEIKVRGLLCMKCNALLGMAGDHRDVLLAAIRYLDKHQSSKDIFMENKGLIQQAEALKDCYHTTGKDFPVPDSAKGVDSGPQELVKQSEKQKAPRLNASDGYGPAEWGKEGKSFPASTNSAVRGSDEKPTYAGARADVSVSLVSGQISPNIKKEQI